MDQIFISYSHIDREYVNNLAETMERRGFNIWVDNRIDYGDQWPHVIQEKLDECVAVIVVMTHHSYKSEWVQNELARAKRKKKYIFPLLLDGDDPWLSVEATQYVDVRDGSLPPRLFYEKLSRAVGLNSKISQENQKEDTSFQFDVRGDDHYKKKPFSQNAARSADGVFSKFLKLMRKSSKGILCPYCLVEIGFRKEFRFLKCPICRSDFPVQYSQNYLNAPPLFIQLIGWSRSGKTVYLQALTNQLTRLGLYWKNCAHAPLTEATLRYVRNVREFLNTGRMPSSTQMELHSAFIMLLHDMERWGGRTLVIRDVAGEIFDSLQFPIEYTPYLLYVPTTFLMISLSDIQQSSQSMDELLNSLIHTLSKHSPHFREIGRNVVVILSKADLIVDQMPKKLYDYLLNDPFITKIKSDDPNLYFNSKYMDNYMIQMENISRIIRDWVVKMPSGKNMELLAVNNNIHLKYSVISSIGRSSIDNGLTVMTPFRVLDPFFWALEFASK